jgi:Zn-dependent membrane protease YugP
MTANGSLWGRTALVKSLRTGNEIVLLLLIAGFLVDRLSDPYLLSLVLVGTVLGVVVLLTWSITDIVGARLRAVSGSGSTGGE